MNFRNFVRRASDFGITIYSIDCDETEFIFSKTWEIPCKMKKVNDEWIGTLYSSTPYLRDQIIFGNKKEVAEKCLEYCILGVINDE